ncbi:MAG: hypothetical protein ACRCXZ_02710 [Patescibacteria group bacterium]
MPAPKAKTLTDTPSNQAKKITLFQIGSQMAVTIEGPVEFSNQVVSFLTDEMGYVLTKGSPTTYTVDADEDLIALSFLNMVVDLHYRFFKFSDLAMFAAEDCQESFMAGIEQGYPKHFTNLTIEVVHSGIVSGGCGRTANFEF